MRICVLASGSKGNSTYVETNNHKILFDMGTNVKYIKERLEELSVSLNDIDTIIISHIHSDHIGALENYIKKYSGNVYMTMEMIGELDSNNPISKYEHLVIFDDDIYLDNINIYADEYINTVLCISPDNENYKKEVSDSFVDMIFYIADHIQKPSNDNIELLDKMFNTYVRLCSKYHVLPTLEVFSFLVGINRTTFTDWMNGEYRTNSSHGNTAKKWFDICKNCAINRLHNQTGTNANLIFVAKAAYGMAETAPVQAVQQYGVPQQTAQQIAEKHKAALQLPEMEKPEL